MLKYKHSPNTIRHIAGCGLVKGPKTRFIEKKHNDEDKYPIKPKSTALTVETFMGFKASHVLTIDTGNNTPLD